MACDTAIENVKTYKYIHLRFFLLRSRAVYHVQSIIDFRIHVRTTLSFLNHNGQSIVVLYVSQLLLLLRTVNRRSSMVTYDEWWCCVSSPVFTSAWNCSRGPNAQSNGIHPKESPTVYSDLADRIDTPLYGKTEHYQMTEDVPSNQQRISARMTGCDDWRAAASATGFGDNER